MTIKSWFTYPFKREGLLPTEEDALRGLMQQASDITKTDPFLHVNMATVWGESTKVETMLGDFEAKFPGGQLTEDSVLTETERDVIFGVHEGNKTELTSKDQLTPETINRYHHDLLNSGDRNRTYVWPQTLVRWEVDYNRRTIRADVYTTDRKFFKDMQFWFRSWIPLPEVRTKKGAAVFVVGTGPGGPRLTNIGFDGEPLIRGNYNDAFLKAYDRIRMDLKAEKPSGRISVMHGPPGTGKTFAVRALLHDVEGPTFIVVPPTMVPELTSPGLVNLLIDLKRKKRTLVLLIEDADEILTARESGNMSAIAAVLNLSDGIIGSLLDLRIVATTNAKKVELDPAVKRSGRLSAIAEVGSLNQERAEGVYKRLTDKDPGAYFKTHKTWVLADVYRKAQEDGLKPEQRMELSTHEPEGLGFRFAEGTSSLNGIIQRSEAVYQQVTKLVDAIESGTLSADDEIITGGVPSENDLGPYEEIESPDDDYIDEEDSVE